MYLLYIPQTVNAVQMSRLLLRKIFAVNFAVLARSCKYIAHENTIGPHSEQAKDRTHICTSVQTCVAEGAAACDALSDCHSYGIGPWHSHPYNAAQLYRLVP